MSDTQSETGAASPARLQTIIDPIQTAALYSREHSDCVKIDVEGWGYSAHMELDVEEVDGIVAQLAALVERAHEWVDDGDGSWYNARTHETIERAPCRECGDELTNDDVCSSCVPSVAERAKPQGDGEWTTADPPARIAFAVRKSDGLVNNMTQMVSRINAYARRVAELEADVAGWEQSFALFHAAHRALAELHEAAYPEMYEPREDGSVLGCIGGTALAEWAVAEIERLARERDEERAKIGDVEEDRDHYYRRGFDVGHAKAQAAVEQLQAISQTTTADCIDPESLDRYRRAREMATAEGISFRAALERVLRDAE